MSPTVYLDTQDFSRFGRVLEGLDKSGAAEVFEQLLIHADEGTARFVYSMSTLSELLQYHPDHEQTSIAKARAVEMLCRGNAMANMSRVIAYEIAEFAYGKGLLKNPSPQWKALCDQDYWFPNLGNAFDGFRHRWEGARQRALLTFVHKNRHERRTAEKALSERAFKRFADDVAREVEEHYGVRSGDFGVWFGLFARGKISSADASRRLFSAVARPTAFIDFYFKRYEGEKDLPVFLRDAGKALQTAIEKMAMSLSKEDLSEVRRQHPVALEAWGRRIGSTIAGFAISNGDEFELSDEVIREVQHAPDILDVKSCGNLVRLIHEYVAQCIGLRGTKSRVEASFGGDLIHAVYLPHVDIWRGDRRFSKLIEDSGVQTSATIVPGLRNLPDAIASFA